MLRWRRACGRGIARIAAVPPPIGSTARNQFDEHRHGALGRHASFSHGYNSIMSFFFPEDDLVRQSPEQTRIVSLEAQPYPDAERIRVNLEMTPFQMRPHIEISLTDADGDEVATASIVEPMTWKLEFTMHLRGATLSPFTVEARLFYPDGPQAEPVTRVFSLAPPN